MKKFIVSVLSISVFFIGLGSLIEKASASFKSDEKALEIIAKARRAIGGDSAISGVKSMTIVGKTTKTFEIEGAAAKTENGETEINFELPNKMSRRLKMGSGDGEGLVDKKVDVIVMRKDGDDNLQWKTEGGDGVNQEAGAECVVTLPGDETAEGDNHVSLSPAFAGDQPHDDFHDDGTQQTGDQRRENEIGERFLDEHDVSLR